MKTIVRLMALSLALVIPQLCLAQAPAGAPAGATGLCNDGTYFKGSVKLGACSGHKGLKTWYGAAKAATPPAKSATATTTKPAPAATTPASSAPKTAAAPAAAPAASSSAPAAAKPAASASSKSSPATTAAAPGGGPGLVWVNTSSKVYHCYGTTYYGKTKAGSYMTEAAAKAAGNHPNGGKACTK